MQSMDEQFGMVIPSCMHLPGGLQGCMMPIGRLMMDWHYLCMQERGDTGASKEDRCT